MANEKRKARNAGRDAAAAVLENPHELLGLVAGETNARIIVEAARARLARIRDANGSEAAVRAFVIGQICRARAAMLRQARRSAGEPRGGGRERSAGRSDLNDRSTGTALAAG